jgi:hypothetical protein
MEPLLAQGAPMWIVHPRSNVCPFPVGGRNESWRVERAPERFPRRQANRRVREDRKQEEKEELFFARRVKRERRPRRMEAGIV